MNDDEGVKVTVRVASKKKPTAKPGKFMDLINPAQDMTKLTEPVAVSLPTPKHAPRSEPELADPFDEPTDTFAINSEEITQDDQNSFFVNTEVEKRPLGMYSDETPDPGLAQLQKGLVADSKHTPVDIEAEVAMITAELAASDEEPAPVLPRKVASVQDKPSRRVQRKAKPDKKPEKIKPKKAPKSAKRVSKKAETLTPMTAKAGGAEAPKAPKRHVFLWIVILLLMLILGAGIGALLFFSGFDAVKWFNGIF